MPRVAENRGYGFKDGDSVVFRRNHNRAKVVTRRAAGQGSGGIPNGFLSLRDAQHHFLFLRFETKRTGLAGDIAGIVLITLRQWREAAETLGGIGFAQGGINANALVEDEALAVVVRPAAFLEIFQDSAIELMDVSEPLAFHVGACLFTTDASGAEHHHGFVFERFRKFGHGLRKVAKMVDAGWECSTKSAEFDLVVVARVEKRDLPAFVEPLLERGGRELG